MAGLDYLLQNVSTLLKLALIAALIVAGLLSGASQPVSFAPSAQGASYLATGPFAISLVFVLYAYSGWNAATYIAGEIKDVQRTLPRSILASLAIVTLLYVALNAVFLRVAPISELAGQIDVGLIAGRHIFGDAGGRIWQGLSAPVLSPRSAR